MKATNPEDNDRDNSRAFRWGIAIVLALVLGAILYNVMSYRKAPMSISEPPAAEQKAPEKPPGS